MLQKLRKCCVRCTLVRPTRCLMKSCCCLLLVVSGVSGLTPVIYPVQTSSQCGQSDPQQDEQLISVFRLARQQLGPPGCNPPSNRSCQEILYCFPSSSSGYYQIHATNGSLVDVYCNMEGTNCGNITGWTRVAYLNMTQPHATCPPPLVRKTTAGLTLCHRSKSGCDRVLYSTLDLSYSQVCGRVRGYQLGRTNAFRQSINNNTSSHADGVIIANGASSHKHIWTYAAGQSEKAKGNSFCPCNNGSIITQSLPFDYYCESGASVASSIGTLYSSDPLWDGQQCGGREASCCMHPNMPWFIKTLNETTTEDIELGVCGNKPPDDEDTPLELVELFVR